MNATLLMVQTHVNMNVTIPMVDLLVPAHQVMNWIQWRMFAKVSVLNVLFDKVGFYLLF